VAREIAHVPSEFGVRRFVGRVNRDITGVDFPIGKSPIRIEALTVDPSGFGVLSSTRTCTQVSRYRETRFPETTAGRSTECPVGKKGPDTGLKSDTALRA
jgi:hypothetical protein